MNGDVAPPNGTRCSCGVRPAHDSREPARRRCTRDNEHDPINQRTSIYRNYQGGTRPFAVLRIRTRVALRADEKPPVDFKVPS